MRENNFIQVLQESCDRMNAFLLSKSPHTLKWVTSNIGAPPIQEMEQQPKYVWWKFHSLIMEWYKVTSTASSKPQEYDVNATKKGAAVRILHQGKVLLVAWFFFKKKTPQKAFLFRVSTKALPWQESECCNVLISGLPSSPSLYWKNGTAFFSANKVNNNQDTQSFMCKHQSRLCGRGCYLLWIKLQQWAGRPHPTSLL